ncbi:HAD family hydrolase [Brevibacillus fortis]|uniref:Haloacid dehalogenase n=1 Tax=Brevibacillus fortis TaxID=2126352 RepID=A0A2P7UGX5_9BACL|nr:HAD family hydrolase [Brevibacillus fortis]PSJ86208.1 haloacid dehalogenase [Brevibacillus fortis]
MSKRWISFDLDGTLMQNPFGAWVFPEIARVIAGQLGREHDIVSEMVAEHERRMSQERYVEAYDWDDILFSRCDALCIEKTIEIESLVRKHSVIPKVNLLEGGILQMFDEMKKRGFSLAVVTNGFYKFQAPVMEALGLLNYFDEIVTPERAGAGKPDPAILQKLSGEVIAHVGDRLDHDIQLANRSHVTSILIERKLPEDLARLQPQMRANDQRMRLLCLEKWKRECKNPFLLELPELFMPQIVICSMSELLSVLNEQGLG